MKRLYYWRPGDYSHGGTNVHNFGDRLNWIILDKLGADFGWSPPEKADLVVLGSILEHLPRNWSGTVCGAGKLYEDSNIDLSSSRVLALRGKLTAASCTGVPADVVLGDPGLLIPSWFRQQVATTDLGIVPHWSDKDLWRRFNHGQLIDVTGPPAQVIEQITKCKRIITSSLHGAVIADAFGIPRRLELFPQARREGGDYKFRDYQSVYSDPDPHFGEFWTAPYDEVLAIQGDLRRALAKALGDPYQEEPPEPVVRRSWWDWFWPCNWRKRHPEISLIVPFRDDGEHRAEVWRWLKKYWEWNLPNAEIIIGTDHRTPFSKSAAINKAARKARGKIFIICDADAYMDAGALKACADEVLAAVKARDRLWMMPYNCLYRLNRLATLAVLGTDPVEPYFLPHPVPEDWLEDTGPQNDPNTRTYGHRYGAMIMVMPREAFFLVNGFDARMRGWGSEDVSMLRALDTLYCQHHVAANDLCHMWHVRPGNDYATRKWVGQGWSPANSRLAQRYYAATGEVAYMRSLCDEHPI